ncbi:helix-turn-helix domain-containing protein [Vagococcus lutrae]|uniref:helix-turn-helix domain-containing protein n=1 Tax=Vagococcus lutrae TaxID=81947 RepID=UPI00200F4CFF|nr:helix-turn-helix transcriptional regulator [Vagococcus lutrae]MDO5741310.1 helix-turn-helix transcriptional regulator [Vagococcus sp.]MCO7151714.1 helix-turn-helix domain-containing protein [Vagococcus lutrae]UQF24243.1 helix-turn-helix domain-containing protein [Vagococcus lutrae]UQF37780.1 helix-turn-helix domain-containing protein [Vagococcus lutrae]UQF63667.1 helix-turn-helix domain-containing protein [Vagococcus lutrae]
MDEKQIYNQISLKAARTDKGYTQEALALKLGIAPKTISEWENNKVPIKPLYLYAIAYVLKIDADSIRI